jgi:tetratricopeptide (TPR) repeat protein
LPKGCKVEDRSISYDKKAQQYQEHVPGADLRNPHRNDAQAWNDRGDAPYKMEKYREAIHWYDKALTLDPSYASA